MSMTGRSSGATAGRATSRRPIFISFGLAATRSSRIPSSSVVISSSEPGERPARSLICAGITTRPALSMVVRISLLYDPNLTSRWRAEPAPASYVWLTINAELAEEKGSCPFLGWGWRPCPVFSAGRSRDGEAVALSRAPCRSPSAASRPRSVCAGAIRWSAVCSNASRRP